MTYYNRAAADLAGREPAIGKDKWCVTFKLFTPDGKDCRMTSARWRLRLRKTGRSAIRRP
ncbi:hypothetical protein [Mesorhizobium caraganae]|uniref:hypothetical protein n=1 Tax=Mesorhizobium caraganae TaxID=483206 RepID=UPI00289DC1ED|nr:hypothetical protein [Mesorhizobium caraganae]